MDITEVLQACKEAFIAGARFNQANGPISDVELHLPALEYAVEAVEGRAALIRDPVRRREAGAVFVPPDLLRFLKGDQQ